MSLRTSIRDFLLRRASVEELWSIYRRRQLETEYQRRREQYEELAARAGLRYEEEDVIVAVRARIAQRGYTPVRREPGTIHTFAIIPMNAWHKHLLPDLRLLGPVSLFDPIALGYGPDGFPKWGRVQKEKRADMLALILPTFRRAHRERPVDWVFCYVGGQNMSPSVMTQITEEFGVPIVNMSFDDKQGWAGPSAGDVCTGTRDITAAFDLYITSARIACEWHLLEGGRPLHMPEAFDNSWYHPREVKKDIAVSFVGAAYGFRRSVVSYLRKYGIPIRTFGEGWPKSGYVSDAAEIFSRSIINLGMGGIGYSENLTNVKGRDFEIPGTGGGVYLTSFNPELATYFNVGKEILCYRNRDEMLGLIRHYLARPEDASEIAERARDRCLSEHRWLHRYTRVLKILEVL